MDDMSVIIISSDEEELDETINSQDASVLGKLVLWVVQLALQEICHWLGLWDTG